MPRHRTAAPAPRSGGRARLVSLALAAILLVLGLALRARAQFVPVYTPDEDAYADFYAGALHANGLHTLPKIVRDYNRRPEMLQYPSPTRVGHLVAILAWMNVTGIADIQTAAQVSMIASIVLLVLIGGFCIAALDPVAAPIAMLFAALSPLDRAMARRVWGDELFALAAFAALVALVAAQRRGGATRGVFFVLAGCSILVKESGLLVLAFGAVWLATVDARSRGLAAAARTLGLGVATAVVTLGVLAFACGGLAPLRATFARAAVAESGSAYMREFQHGGPGYYVKGLGLLQPVPIALGLVAALIIAGRLARGGGTSRSQKDRSLDSLAPLAGFVLVFVVVACVYPQKNLRFLSPVYAPMFVLAAALIAAAFRALGARLARPSFLAAAGLVVALLVASAAQEQRRFVHYFITRGVPDLATPWLVRAPR